MSIFGMKRILPFLLLAACSVPPVEPIVPVTTVEVTSLPKKFTHVNWVPLTEEGMKNSSGKFIFLYIENDFSKDCVKEQAVLESTEIKEMLNNSFIAMKVTDDDGSIYSGLVSEVTPPKYPSIVLILDDQIVARSQGYHSPQKLKKILLNAVNAMRIAQATNK